MKFAFASSLVLSLFILSTPEKARFIRYKPGETCLLNKIVENDCNYCSCLEKGYLCSMKNCDRRKRQVYDMTSSMDRSESKNSLRRDPQCQPNTLYMNEYIKCVCDEKGHWPHETCQNTFHNLFIQTNKDVRESLNKMFILLERIRRFSEIESIYAKCESKKEYHMDNRLCTCVRNNRLSCVEEIIQPTSYHVNSDDDDTNDEVNEGDNNNDNNDSDNETVDTGDDSNDGNDNTGNEESNDNEEEIVNVLEENVTNQLMPQVESIYSECVPGVQYMMDGSLCVCTRLKRLQCSKPDSVELRRNFNNSVDIIPVLSQSHVACVAGSLLRMDCNTCFCLKSENLLCTYKKCDE